MIWDQFKELIFQFLVQIQGHVGDWGMSIIVLTVLVRLALTPLTIKQTRSTYEMQRIQPKIKELQKKYANDKEKLQEETLKFYQENKVNPLSGCLPMLLQMPLLFALYQVIGGTKAKPGLLMAYLTKTGTIGKFYFLIPDISHTPSSVFSDRGLVAALPYIVLVVLFGLSVWLPQALMPGEKQQKIMGAYMAALMLFFGWTAPAGVLLYWDISSLWGVIQQQLTLKFAKNEQPQKAVAAEEPAPTPKNQQAAPQKAKKKKKKKK
ncbi:MAG: YidC/Oxa1 family membrane protein insertase [Coriobacteriia bacterium]|nr:YidC/Oxa1 family membrane protein insertase [Coriobacteriia bacterium]